MNEVTELHCQTFTRKKYFDNFSLGLIPRKKIPTFLAILAYSKCAFS